VACYLQAVNLLICEWTFHWPIGYSVAMTCHAFLVGEVINELYLQTKHFFYLTASEEPLHSIVWPNY
jgi:hypothetical protein